MNTCGSEENKTDEQEDCVGGSIIGIDGSYSKELIYESGGETKTVYIKIPKDVRVKNASWTITGVMV